MRSIVLASALTLAAAAAQTSAPPLNELLRDGLFAEEVSQDSEEAARNYNRVLSRAAADEPFIANALFRLAEIRRKQDRRDEAIALYQRLLTRYPDADPQAKLSREALAKLGVADTTSPGPIQEDDESREVQRLEKLLQSSPDLLRKDDFFLDNIQKGWERPIVFLLDHGVAANREAVGNGLVKAATIGHLNIVKAILSRGVDQKGDLAKKALCCAVNAGNTAIVKLLLESGITPLSERAGDIPSHYPPLGLAATRNHLDIARLLLEHGADVNQGPLEEGRSIRVEGLTTSYANPLFAAIANKHAGMVALLIEKRANLNVASSYTEATPLALAADISTKTGTEILSQLLAAGADLKTPVPGSRSLLQRAAFSDNVESLKLLLDRGAVPEPGWIASGFTPSGENARLELLQRYAFPVWSQESKVRIIVSVGGHMSDGAPGKTDSDNNFITTTPILADRDKNDALGCPAALLLEVKFLSASTPATELTLYRRKQEGGYLTIPFDFGNPAPYPELQWGDILMVGYKQSTPPRSGSSSSGWSDEIGTSLLQHVVVPIIVELNGREQALTLHGDCLVYDPTKPVAPWLGSRELAGLLFDHIPDQHITITIHRKGSAGPISIDPNDPGSDKPLRAGDRLVIHRDKQERRKDEVRVVSPDLWFDLRLGEDPFFSREEAERQFLPPTLFQAIADCYTGIRWPDNLPYPSTPLKLLERMHGVRTLLPHPDLAHVRIRRQNSDGGETIIDVNIDEAASRCTNETTSAEARLLDQPLVPGDIVELKTLPGTTDVPWAGFNEAQSRLFTKALSGQVTLVSGGQSIAKDILYAPATMLPSSYGPVPVERSARNRTPLRLAEALRGWGYSDAGTINLTRNGKTSEVSVPAVLLQDGDRIESKSGLLPQGVRPPRPRSAPNTPGR
ncbi:ankyrin repeat domain-containing protein [Luteolibacter ambystomatis]|uniref:Ankyrin repeat domain-containing protein n=1 Tax=Luteolibacter ambystomatis TaxID=2824561 RepID=A0A975G5Z6_9BACT|nr:ankyrin repeat domain-containing protein [Luteolibacter ambystomatis]QUE49719.1 ankyrin repeat domain-containing protein [Luteolibacter ambystomatis]